MRGFWKSACLKTVERLKKARLLWEQKAEATAAAAVMQQVHSLGRPDGR